MGLLGLCVEFYRVTPTGCSFDDFGNPLSSSANSFPYGNATCGLVCSVEEGPFSRMRGGAANNVNIIPVPKILTFNAVMLLAAGFCIPAILGLIFTWDKIVEINWKRRSSPERLNEQIEGVNMTVGEMNGINNVVRKFLRVIEIPLFGGVILTLIAIGEANFFSTQVRYDMEPMASIGESMKSCSHRTRLTKCRTMVANSWNHSRGLRLLIPPLVSRRREPHPKPTLRPTQQLSHVTLQP